MGVLTQQHENYWIIKSSKLILMCKEQHKKVNATGKHRYLFFKTSFHACNDIGMLDDQIRD